MSTTHKSYAETTSVVPPTRTSCIDVRPPTYKNHKVKDEIHVSGTTPTIPHVHKSYAEKASVVPSTQPTRVSTRVIGRDVIQKLHHDPTTSSAPSERFGGFKQGDVSRNPNHRQGGGQSRQSRPQVPPAEKKDIKVEVILPGDVEPHTFYCIPRKQTEVGRELISGYFQRIHQDYLEHQDLERYKKEIKDLCLVPEINGTSRHIFFLIEYYVCLYQVDVFVENKFMSDLLECRFLFDKEDYKYYKTRDLVRDKFPYVQNDESEKMVVYRGLLYSEESYGKMVGLLYELERKHQPPTSTSVAGQNLPNVWKRLPLNYDSCMEELQDYVSKDGQLDSSCKAWYSESLMELNLDSWLQVWFTLHQYSMVEMTYKIMNSVSGQSQPNKKQLGMLEKKNFLDKNLRHIISGISYTGHNSTTSAQANEMMQWIIRNLSYHPIVPDQKYYPFAMELKKIVNNPEATEMQISIAHSMLEEMKTSSRTVESSTGTKKTVHDLQAKLFPSSESPFPSTFISDFYTKSLNYDVMGFEKFHIYCFQKFSGDYKRTICQFFEEKTDIPILIKRFLHHCHQQTKTPEDSSFFSKFISGMNEKKKEFDSGFGEKKRSIDRLKREINGFNKLGQIEGGNYSADFLAIVRELESLRKSDKTKRIREENKKRREQIDIEQKVSTTIEAKIDFLNSIMQKMKNVWTPLFISFTNHFLDGVFEMNPEGMSTFVHGMMNCVNELCGHPTIDPMFDDEFIDEWKQHKKSVKKENKGVIQFLATEFTFLCSKYIEEAIVFDSEEVVSIKMKMIPTFMKDIARTLAFYEVKEGEEVDEEDQNEMIKELENELYQGLLAFVRSDLKKLVGAYLAISEGDEEEINRDLLFTVDNKLRNYHQSKEHIFLTLKSHGLKTPVEKIEKYLEEVRDGNIGEF